jgi:hypothetical protein
MTRPMTSLTGFSLALLVSATTLAQTPNPGSSAPRATDSGIARSTSGSPNAPGGSSAPAQNKDSNSAASDSSAPTHKSRKHKSAHPANSSTATGAPGSSGNGDR